MLGYLAGVADYPISKARTDFTRLVGGPKLAEVVRITRRGQAIARIEAIPSRRNNAGR